MICCDTHLKTIYLISIGLLMLTGPGIAGVRDILDRWSYISGLGNLRRGVSRTYRTNIASTYRLLASSIINRLFSSHVSGHTLLPIVSTRPRFCSLPRPPHGVCEASLREAF